eukprot:UN08688
MRFNSFAAVLKLISFGPLYLCEFLNYDNDQIMKKHIFLLKNSIFIFLLAHAHSSARYAPRYILQKMWILVTF